MEINTRMKKYHHYLTLLSLFMLLGILKLQAAIQLPAIFSNHMVLQRNSELTFWGWGIPGETISIAPEWMKGEIIKTQVNNTGKWSARVPSGEAGGPYEIRFSGSSEVTLTDVMLGEVWLCSGQSNMEWSANHGIKNGDEETANAHCPNLRIFHVARIAAPFPQENCFSQWTQCTPETMRNTSALAYFFGRNIQEELDVPVGIIVAAWGGTTAETWTPRECVYMNMDDIIDVPTEWFGWADKSSPVHFLGTHCYDQIRWYMGCEIEEVSAVGTKKVLKSKGIDTYDSIQATLKKENGCYWTVENSWILPKGFAKNNDGRTQILCENAMFRIDSQNRGVEMFNHEKQRTPNSYFILNNCGRPSGFGIEPINDFIYCLQKDIPFIADGNDGLQAELVAEAVHESLETEKKVQIKRD